MENRPGNNRELVIPALIGLISLVGIGLIYLMTHLNTPSAPVPVEASPTVLGYHFLGTETATSTPLPELEVAPSEEISSAEVTSPKLAGTVSPVSIIGAETASPASSEGSVLAGKHDDTDLNIDYGNQWTVRGHLESAFQKTLHISTKVGNTAKFTFVGERLYLGYQRGPESSTMTIIIDEDQYVLNQAAGNIWISPQLSYGDHSVTLTHENGESVSLDYITIIGES